MLNYVMVQEALCQQAAVYTYHYAKHHGHLYTMYTILPAAAAPQPSAAMSPSSAAAAAVGSLPDIKYFKGLVLKHAAQHSPASIMVSLDCDVFATVFEHSMGCLLDYWGLKAENASIFDSALGSTLAAAPQASRHTSVTAATPPPQQQQPQQEEQQQRRLRVPAAAQTAAAVDGLLPWDHDFLKPMVDKTGRHVKQLNMGFFAFRLNAAGRRMLDAYAAGAANVTWRRGRSGPWRDQAVFNQLVRPDLPKMNFALQKLPCDDAHGHELMLGGGHPCAGRLVTHATRMKMFGTLCLQGRLADRGVNMNDSLAIWDHMVATGTVRRLPDSVVARAAAGAAAATPLSESDGYTVSRALRGSRCEA